jgi:hypothetical protein
VRVVDKCGSINYANNNRVLKRGSKRAGSIRATDDQTYEANWTPFHGCNVWEFEGIFEGILDVDAEREGHTHGYTSR